ncbi:MAG: lysophospholipid acyltransferase family protein [Cetobacterium sp.]|uniref:lysophospholipid acyltransferase family protein n=1 Tax=unclassified Cetobacterium TaxID=2630983 RepID=UPI00163B8B5D|nr:lysophospholipid acyltransferase family protein [Cetobacterium sp. 2A]MBC2856272.1 1-acyl-sn-glycerol-3-phosphate acyltransferase [Cetobacterium sp. 2A]
MLGLILAIFTAVAIFIYITIFHLSRINKMKERFAVDEARKQMKFLGTSLLKVLRVKVEVQYVDKEAIMKLDKSEGIVLVSNHESNFDIPVIISSFPMLVGFVAKKEMENWPFYSTWMKKSNCIFLDRSNPREGIKSIKKAVEIAKNGYPTVIFPEGERSSDGNIGEFKKGSFKLAVETDGIIIPITIVGTREIQKRSSVLINIGKRVKIVIGKPIHVKKLSHEELKVLHTEVKKIIETNKNIV